MKKYMLYILLCCFIGSIQAQNRGTGIRIGYNFSNLSGDIEHNNVFRALHVGAFTDFQIKPRWFLKPEIQFSVQGSKLDDDDATELKYSYLNIPLLLSYYPNSKLNFVAGPQVGVLMGAKHGDNDVIEDSSSYDIALVIGAEYDLFYDISFSIRYQKGFVDVAEKEDGRWTNDVFQFSLGYVF